VASSEKRTRGPNKQPPWSRNPDDGTTVLRLALDASDPRQRARIEAMFEGAYRVRRALQRDARARCRAYWAATHERARGPSAVRERLGLSRSALEDAAYAHLDAAPHLRRSVTKALAMHLADSVWTAAERHLFRDASGGRHGAPRAGRWFDFTRLPGRARSHTAGKQVGDVSAPRHARRPSRRLHRSRRRVRRGAPDAAGREQRVVALRRAARGRVQRPCRRHPRAASAPPHRAV
jgi:hypothetical protein